jgi:predicted AlkP superfamily phosphohydrolase/phosphomutase
MAKKSCIFYLIDGARPDILSKYMDEGHLPNIKKYLVDQGSFTYGTTCFPSTTGPAYLPFLTGRMPGDHHITGIRWFDKIAYFKGRWKKNAFRSYCGYEASYFNEDMDPKMPSLLETYEDSYNIYNMITKGVDEEKDLTKKKKTGLYFNAHFKHIHHKVDEYGHEKLLESIDKDPEFVFAVFPSIDWDSHTYHFDHEKTLNAYKIVDNSVKELAEKLIAKGTYEDTLIFMASDHGLSSTHSHIDLGKFFRKSGYRVLEYPTIWTHKPKVAVFISGNSFASIHFLDKKEIYYSHEMLMNHGDAIEKLVNEEAIDFVAMRKEENIYLIKNQDGDATVEYLDSKFSYKPGSADPFKLGTNIIKLNHEEAFKATLDSDYPDALLQCHQLFSSHRAGDLIISASIGFDLRDFWEYPEHKGSHGSLHKEHMLVPILTNQKDHITSPIRTTEAFKIINNWLN